MFPNAFLAIDVKAGKIESASVVAGAGCVLPAGGKGLIVASWRRTCEDLSRLS